MLSSKMKIPATESEEFASVHCDFSVKTLNTVSVFHKLGLMPPC